jgi:hypothetical protein
LAQTLVSHTKVRNEGDASDLNSRNYNEVHEIPSGSKLKWEYNMYNLRRKDVRQEITIQTDH